MASIEEQYRNTKEKIDAVERSYTAAELSEKFESSVADIKEHVPTPEVTIFFGRHSSASDLKSMTQEFKDCDVLMLELSGHNEQDENQMQRFSDKETPEPGKHHEPYFFSDGLLSMMRGSRKGIILCDVPENHPLLAEAITADEDLDALMNENLKKYNYDGIMKRLTSLTLAFSQSMRNREEYMVEQFAVRYPKLIHARPNLASKSSVRVLVRIGAAHRSITERFRTRGILPDEKFQEDYDRQIVMYKNPLLMPSILATLGHEITPELISHAILHVIIKSKNTHVWNRVLQSGEDNMKSFLENLDTAFSEPEIRKLWEDYRTNKLNSDDLEQIIASKIS